MPAIFSHRNIAAKLDISAYDTIESHVSIGRAPCPFRMKAS
jgi:hypothetical protein